MADYQSIRELMHKRLRWIVVMRYMRPWGHFGLLFTHGLPWSLAAVAIHPTRPSPPLPGRLFRDALRHHRDDRHVGPEAGLVLAETCL